MSFFSFGPWRPDLPDRALLDDSGSLRLIQALNVVPDVGCYQPQSSEDAITDTLTSTCMGAFSCRDVVGNVNWFAGIATKLKRISSNTSTWSTVGSGYVLTPEDRWEFVKYGNQVFATAVTEDLQFMTMSAGASFAAVGGLPPRFRHLAIVRNFMVGIGTATDPQRVQWSAVDNPQSWTLAAVTQADFQDLFGPGGWNQGAVVGLAGADACIIQERAVWRMLYVGTPLIFQFDAVESARGAIAAGSIVQSAGFAYYLSDDGFYKFDGTTSTPIGQGKVDKFFLDDCDAGAYGQITSAVDADRPLVMWSYRSNTSPQPDKVIVYNWQTEEWSTLDVDCELIWRPLLRHSANPGKPIFSSFSTFHRATIFNGGNKRAEITTAEYQFNQDMRSFISEIYPVVEGGSPVTQILHRPNSFATLSNEISATLNAHGFCPLRVDDRFMRIYQTISLSATWSKWRGFKADPLPSGLR